MQRLFPFLFCLFLSAISGTALAQQSTTAPADSVAQPAPPPGCLSLTGLVTDENFQPLTGATVQVQGINDAYSTNSEGRYIVTSKKPLPRPARLKISAVGYETEEFALNTCIPPDVALRLAPGTRFKRDGRIKKTTITGKVKW
ncbi:carboxypeptidase-like regulatory domain-containing protein [uncultured Hymenobacter sp.]|uniref:carboxypeptidase-like regulatory domain-containing protein n=1 Tax=uncultured Hymenobacter sp. TaxID=170016 RepID=UPI0035CACEAE